MDVQQEIFARGVHLNAKGLLKQYGFTMHIVDSCGFRFTKNDMEIWLGYSRDGPDCRLTIEAKNIEHEHLYQLYKRFFGEPTVRPVNPWSASENIESFMFMLPPVIDHLMRQD